MGGAGQLDKLSDCSADVPSEPETAEYCRFDKYQDTYRQMSTTIRRRRQRAWLSISLIDYFWISKTINLIS